MRRLLAALLVVAFLTGCAPTQQDGGPDFPKVGPAKIDVDTPQLRAMKAKTGIEDCRPGHASNDLPAVTLPCLGGGPAVRLDRLTGPLVVSVWASWCGPCRKELPYYQQLSRKYAGKARVIGIDYTDPQTVGAMDLLRDTGVTFPQLADPQSDVAAQKPFPRMNQLPVLLLVDSDGTVVHVEIGELTSYDELEGLVHHYLGVTA